MQKLCFSAIAAVIILCAHGKLAASAGVKRLVGKDDPRLVLTEHPRPDGSSLVVAVNARNTPVECPVRIDGTVGRAWNGALKDGILSIGANDGCVFECFPRRAREGGWRP